MLAFNLGVPQGLRRGALLFHSNSLSRRSSSSWLQMPSVGHTSHIIPGAHLQFQRSRVRRPIPHLPLSVLKTPYTQNVQNKAPDLSSHKPGSFLSFLISVGGATTQPGVQVFSKPFLPSLILEQIQNDLFLAGTFPQPLFRRAERTLHVSQGLRQFQY